MLVCTINKEKLIFLHRLTIMTFLNEKKTNFFLIFQFIKKTQQNSVTNCMRFVIGPVKHFAW